MKRALLFVLALSVATPAVLLADNKGKKGAKPAASKAAEVDDAKEIRWMNIDDVQVAMKEKPKKVLIDVYTDWCGWCKVMDKKTFSNPEVIKYVNKHFYAVKLNAEQKEAIRFNGSMFNFKEEFRANEFAVNLLRGQMSYPTTIIMEENFQNPQPIPGYLDVPTIEMILKYLGENMHKTKQFTEWQQSFKASWAVMQ